MMNLGRILLTFIPFLLAASSAATTRDRLADILAAQPEEVQARYTYRHPMETLGFFGIEPGMTVVEVLPGGGWYSKILLPYLGTEGHLAGADYPMETWQAMYSNEEFLAGRKTWAADWTAEAQGWHGEEGAEISAFALGSLPQAMLGSADAVLFIRAMHGLNRSGVGGEYLKAAVQDAWDLLKPGGIVGVVQHEARAEMPDSWADGSNGYLKREYVAGLMQAAGFEFVGETDVNANDKDRPSESEFVWRLPPRFAGTPETDTEARAALQALGESNRMTLKFMKP